MARQTYRITDLESEKSVPLGLNLPMNNSRGSGLSVNYTSLSQARANLINLILTNKGERVMNPQFGCDLNRSLMESNVDGFVEAIESRILEAVELYLPTVEITDLQVESTPDKLNTVSIKISYNLRNSESLSETFQLQITL